MIRTDGQPSENCNLFMLGGLSETLLLLRKTESRS